jgi:hypothetical protein
MDRRCRQSGTKILKGVLGGFLGAGRRRIGKLSSRADPISRQKNARQFGRRD